MTHKQMTSDEIRLVASSNAISRVKDALRDLKSENSMSLNFGDVDNGTHANIIASENVVYQMLIDYLKDIEATVIAQ